MLIHRKRNAARSGLLFTLCVGVCASAFAEPRITEIDRGHSWVSPYWGYSAPKIVFDGANYFTTGLWGNSPETAHGVVYKFDGQRWHQGALLPEIYQPAIVLLDKSKRLIVIYNTSNGPIKLLRAAQPGQIDAFDPLPAPDMTNAFYVGAAIRDDFVYIAYVTTPAYLMFLTRFNIGSAKWSSPMLISEGQPNTTPKTAWTYPILVPDENGLHLCASNCPDGGEGNTYNMIWYLFVQNGASAPERRELVAESPVGSNAYATDMTVMPDGTVHIAHMWNGHKYGPPIPSDSPKEGLYVHSREPATGAWKYSRLADISIAGFWNNGTQLQIISEDGGILTTRSWDAGGVWGQPSVFVQPTSALTAPSFLDVISTASGSIMPASIAMVTDGFRLEAGKTSDERILWAVLP